MGVGVLFRPCSDIKYKFFLALEAITYNYNPQIQKSGETKTKGSKSGKNRGKSQFQAVIEI